MNVTLPDGMIIQDVPDGTTKIQLLAKLHQSGYDIKPLLAAENLNPANRPDPTVGMSGTEKFLAGAGKAFTDLYRGTKQLLPGQNLDQEIAESRQLDVPLMKTGAGIAGNLAGYTAALAPTAFIPGANTYTGAALIGAGSGLLNPTTQDESKLTNATWGAAAGMAGQGLGRLAGRVLRPVQPALNEEQQAIANAAVQQGIPLRASQATGSKPLAITESVMENLPFTSESQIAKRAGQQQAYTKAVLTTAGINSDKATPQVLNDQFKRLGDTFENIASKHTLDFNQPVNNLGGKSLVSHLSDVVGQAQNELPPQEAGRIAKTVENILSQVDDSGQMLGSNYQGWRTPLRRLAKSGNETSHYFGQVKSALDNAFTDQIGGQDAGLWNLASKQYANLKTISDAMGQAGAASKTGMISPSALEGSFTKQIGREAKARGRGNLNDLVSIGRTFVSDNLPDSYTSQRQFYTNLLTGQLAGAVPGAAVGYYENRSPEGAILGALGGSAVALGLPKVVQMGMNSPVMQSYLINGAVPVTEAGRNFMAHLGRTALLANQMATPSR